MKLNLSIGALVALQLAAGLALQLTVLAIIGIGPKTDAFIAAQAIPLVLFAVLAASLQNVWQPRLSRASSNPSEWRAMQSVAQGQALLLFGATAGLLVVTAGWWAAALFPGIGEPERSMTIQMSRMLLIGALFNGHAALLTVAQRARSRFVVAEATTLAGALLAIPAAWLLVPRFGIEAAAWVSLGRSGMVCVALYQLAERPRPSPRQAWSCGEIWRQLAPLLASSSLYKTGPLVDRYWSSQSSAGGMTVFSLAQTAIGALATIIERAVCMPVGSQMGRLVGAGDFESLRQGYRHCVWRVTLAVVPVALCLTALLPLWPTLIGRVFRVDVATAQQMWLICMLLLGYLHVAASGTIVVAAFYAMGDTRTPSVVLLVGFSIGLALKSVGFLVMGLEGLAAATSAYHLINLALLSATLERRLQQRITARDQC